MISILHPSRWRPEMALKAWNEWMQNANNPDQIEYILSLDTSDSTQNEYFRLFEYTDVQIIINHNRSIVDAVNQAAKVATKDIFVVVSDDFGCPLDWDMDVVGYCADENPVLLHVNDTIQTDVCTLPIMNRKFYDRFGWVYHPHYYSMFADNDLTECAKKIGAYVSDFSLTFEHRHYVNGKNKRDKTYDRENSKQAWDIGKRVFQQRKLRQFELP
jgi:hypothetical protein